MEMKSGVRFVLVHGSCMGAWCWYKLIPLLRSAGHRATAVDLGASGKNPKQVDQLSTMEDYFEPLMKVMEEIPPEEKVILVGHSMGGVATAVAMEKFPHKVHVGVFVTAYMPGPNLTPKEITKEFNLPPGFSRDTEYAYLQGKDKPETSFLFGPDFIASTMYQLSPPEDAILATLLARPYPNFFDEQSEKECALTEQNYGSLRRVFIVATDDSGLTKERQMMMIRKNPPDEVIEVNSADHMVMCSKPQELCFHLRAIADKYAPLKK